MTIALEAPALAAPSPRVCFAVSGRRGAEWCKVVVGADDDSANRFYDALGFRRVSTIAVHEGTDSYVWVAACRS